MNGGGEYHAEGNKPIPQNSRLNVFSAMWMLIHNKWENNTGTWIRERGVKGGDGTWG